MIEIGPMDAVDCLFIFGYTIKRALAPPGSIFIESEPIFQLCNDNVDKEFKKSIGLLLQEVDQNKEYYSKRICEIGEALP